MTSSGAPTVSVVIPTYNQGALLRRALESVTAQNFPNWEAIIINNESHDDTLAVIASFAEPRFQVINFRNHGVIAASRNQGIRQARGEWVAFLDSDDFWQPEKLSCCLAAVQPEIDLITHREVTVENGNVLRTSPPLTQSDIGYRALLYRGNCLSPTAVMVRKSALMTVGGFAEDPALITAEDFDLWLRLAKLDIRGAFVDRVLSEYSLHGANNSGSIDRHMSAGLAVIDQHFAEIARGPLAFIRHRRSRARAIYGAGRSHQHAGRPAKALSLFMQSLRAYPFLGKTYAAIAIVGFTMTLGFAAAAFGRA